MMNYKRIQRLLMTFTVVIVACWATLSGCTTTADYTLGEELAPGHQQLEMRHRLYKKGVIKESGMDESPCKLFEMRLYRTDSINAASLDKLYLGLHRDDRFGVRKMGFASQYLFMSVVDDSIGFGYRPVYDSMMFIFEVDTFVGDTTKPIKYNVYALTNDLVNEQSEDSLFIITYDPRRDGHLAVDAEPIFTFEYPNPAKGVYTTSKQVRLQETPQSRAFIRRLACMEKLDENGLANSNVEAYKSDSAFIHNFPGIYIEPADDMPDGEGSSFSFTPASTGISFHGRTRNTGADVDIMADTIALEFHFRDANATDYGNVSAQRVTFDYSASEFASTPMYESEANRPEVELGFVDGCGGMITEFTLTDEFLLSLHNLVRDAEGNKTHASAAVNQAALKIYLEGADYDYTVLDPIVFGDKLNNSISRLGMYFNYKILSPIPDYYYSLESAEGSLAYNGYANRSLACYEMDITSYIQQVINDMIDMEPREDGTFDLEKLTYPHKIFLAPSADNIFTFNRSVLQGADVEINPAAIVLELTYTLVK